MSVEGNSTMTYSRYMAWTGVGSSGTTIVAKASAGPTIEKKIVTTADDPSTTDKNEEKLEDYDSVAANETVEFKLTSAIPVMEGYNRYYFIINDTMSAGLTFDKIESVKVGDTTLTETSDTTDIGATYEFKKTVSSDNITSFTITFKNFIQYANYTNKEITVYYTAKVNENIVVGDTNENKNDVDLTYSNNPNYTYNGTPADPDKPKSGDPTITTPKDTVYVYTAGIALIKTDGDGKRLTGATFKISSDSSDNTSYTVLKVTPKFEAVCYDDDKTNTFPSGKTQYYKLLSGGYTDTPYSESDAQDRYVTENVKYAKDGEAYVKSSDGEYIKFKAKVSEDGTETEEEGYILASGDTDGYVFETHCMLYQLNEEKSFETVNAEAETGESTSGETTNSVSKGIEGVVSESDGVIYFSGLKEGTYTITEEVAPTGYAELSKSFKVEIKFDSVNSTDMVCKWDYSINKNGIDNMYLPSQTINNGIYEIEVKNYKTTHLLPTTGGIGTTIFYIVGSVIVIGAVVLLITKRRMRSEDE
jgi:fimbrial isopeptide formation D2 family protein/LPXTG-motif cell wall-anchored protein